MTLQVPDFICGQCEGKGFTVIRGVSVVCPAQCTKERAVFNAAAIAQGYTVTTTGLGIATQLQKGAEVAKVKNHH